MVVRSERHWYFYSRPCGRGDCVSYPGERQHIYFYSRPCGRGDKIVIVYGRGKSTISTHAPAGGATRQDLCGHGVGQFLLTPLREGRPPSACRLRRPPYFYSRPCGRGDAVDGERYGTEIYFYSRPCGRGDSWWRARRGRTSCDFYSRPCGRGDAQGAGHGRAEARISTHAPAGGATFWIPSSTKPTIFLLTPLREGRPGRQALPRNHGKFLLTPLREGRRMWRKRHGTTDKFLLTPLREGRPKAV